MIEEKRVNRGEQLEEQVNILEILFRYLIHWPWFVVSVIVCIVCAWGYLQLATPVYNISATVLIKDEEKGGGASMSSELEKMGLIYPVKGRGNFVADSSQVQKINRESYRKEFTALIQKGRNTGFNREELEKMFAEIFEKEDES